MFVGTRHIQIADESEGVSFPALVMYPTAVPSTPTAWQSQAVPRGRKRGKKWR